MVWSPNSRGVDLENLKEQLVAKHTAHFTISRSITQKEQALWYRGSRKESQTHFQINIRVPAMIGVPDLMPRDIKEINNILLVPFILVLMHALDLWDFEALRGGGRADSPDCERRERWAYDVHRMLKSNHVLSSRNELSHRGATYLDDGHREDMRQKIHRFCGIYPDFAEEWKLLGFELNPTMP